MILVKFKKMERSELAREVVIDRVNGLVDKFEDLKASRITVTLEMQNSPRQAGLDVFEVKLQISRGRFDSIIIAKSDSNMYRALAKLLDDLLEKLNRKKERDLESSRREARHFEKAISRIEG